jgi:hypothetical protein
MNNNPPNPFSYDPTFYDTSFFHGLANVDSTNAAAANFARGAYNFDALGFPTRRHSLYIENHICLVNYFNQTPSAYLHPPTFPPSYQPSTQMNPKIESPAPIQKSPPSNSKTERREKPKRRRILFTGEQIRLMEESFKVCFRMIIHCAFVSEESVCTQQGASTTSGEHRTFESAD